MLTEPTVDPSTPPPAEPSLSDHEQTFHVEQSQPAPQPKPTAPVSTEEDAEPEARDDQGRFRAKSQRAKPADVETINQLTKRLRDAEDALGVTVEREEGESDRVFNLRRRAILAEAARDAKTAKPPAPKPLPKVEDPKAFTEQEPRYEDFADEADQYAAHLRAVAAYDRRKEAFEATQTQSKAQQEAAIKERNDARDAWFQSQEQQHYGRMKAYHEAHPEAQAILDDAGDVSLTPAVYAAVMTAPNSPELLMLLAQNEELRDTLTDLTEGKPLNQDLVARVQRRLNREAKAGTTGSAPLPLKPVPAVPRPPNPVRTGPMKTDDTPPGDEDSLAAHEKFFGGKRR